jgi:hypothetical protein
MAVSDVPEGRRLGPMVLRTHENAPQTRKTMIVALARKLLIALWRLAREGTNPEGVVLHPAL